MSKLSLSVDPYTSMARRAGTSDVWRAWSDFYVLPYWRPLLRKPRLRAAWSVFTGDLTGYQCFGNHDWVQPTGAPHIAEIVPRFKVRPYFFCVALNTFNTCATSSKFIYGEICVVGLIYLVIGIVVPRSDRTFLREFRELYEELSVPSPSSNISIVTALIFPAVPLTSID